MTLARLFEGRPLLASVSVLVILNLVWWVLFPLTMVVLSIPAAMEQGSFGSHPSPLVTASATALWAVVVKLTARHFIVQRGWAHVVGFNMRWREPWLTWILVPFVLINLNNLLGRMLRVGMYEEVVFRGLILGILLTRFHRTRAEIIGAVLFSGLLFGIWHLGAFVSHEIPWQHAAANVVYAAIDLANWLPALLTRGDVAPAVVLARPGAAWQGAIFSILVCLPVFLYGLWLLRDMGKLDLTPWATPLTAPVP